MIRIDREELLRVLESVTPGLATKEIIEQSSCFVFTKGKVMTFNDEVACSRESPLDITGAVKAAPVLDLLSKLTEDEIQIEKKPSELVFKGKRRKSGIALENEVLLPVDCVEIPTEWKELPSDFSEAIGIVHGCASTDQSEFMLTCIHLNPRYLEACDRYQIARFPLKMSMERPVLVRADSLKKILGLDMTEFSETDAWIHFRNPAGLVYSCRRFLDKYASLGKFLKNEGLKKITLPGALEEIINKAEIFSRDNLEGNHVTVELQADRIVITGQGASGWYKEMKEIAYNGDPIKFMINPKLLLEVSKKSNECGVSQDRLFIDGGKYRYTTSTQVPESDEE